MTSDGESILWRQSSGERFAAPALGGDLTVDLAIIGGGFAGCAAALEAARRGASVAVLEAETVGHGGSGRNVGLANAGLWLKPDEIVAAMGEAAATRLIDVLAEAPARVYGLIEREGIDCEAVRNGTLHLAHSSAGYRDLADRWRQGVARGAPLVLFGADETARRTGSDAFYGALFDPRAGTIQPLAYCRGLARAAVAAGAAIFEASPAVSITHGDLWQVGVNGYTVRAKALLVTTNAYHLGIETPFRPHYVPMHYCQFATAAMGDAARGRILAGGEGCWDTALVMSSLRIDRAGRMVIGGIGNSDGPGAMVHAGWARRKLKQLFPEIGGLPFEYGWQGRIAVTTDHIPKIVEFGPAALACFGYSGRGIGPGTVFGTQAAIALLDGTPDALPEDPIPHYTERFTGALAAWYEFGATVIHAAGARC